MSRKILLPKLPSGKSTPLIRGSEVVDRGTSLEGQLREMARTRGGMVVHILRTMRTMRLVKTEPTWSNLISSEWGGEVRRALPVEEFRIYRSLWSLIESITTEKEERNRIEFAIAVMKERLDAKRYGTAKRPEPSVFGITDPKLEDHVRKEALARTAEIFPGK